MVQRMSKKKRNMVKQKKEQARQVKRAAKAQREKHDPLKWEEKKAKKHSKQEEAWNSKYPDANKDCELSLSKAPSTENCSNCRFDCPYNHKNTSDNHNSWSDWYRKTYLQ